MPLACKGGQSATQRASVECGGYQDGGSVPMGLARFDLLPTGDAIMSSFGMSPPAMWPA